MHVTGRVVLALLPVLAGAGVAFARCEPDVEPDRSDVATARAAVADACDCAGAVARRDYVRCATEEAKRVLANPGCAGTVKRCASKSTCGKPGYVACCRTRSSGKTSCTIKRSADRCVAPNGGSACVSSLPSCCDACGASGCNAVTTTTTTTTTTSTTLDPLRPCGPDAGGTCGGLCPSFFDDCVQDSGTGECVCVPGPCRAVGGIGSCGGTCPAPAICSFFPPGCGCIIPCAGSGAPPCDPPCGPSQGCLYDPSASACRCAP